MSIGSWISLALAIIVPIIVLYLKIRENISLYGSLEETEQDASESGDSGTR